MKRKENFQWLPKELHQLKYEAISVPQGSVRLVKKTQERKSSTCYLLITKGVTSSSPVPLKTRRERESGVGIYAVLQQNQKPIAFAFRTLNKRNYTVTERECLAVIWALNKFKTYFGPLSVKVITNHPALTKLTNGKNLSSRMIRWALKLSEFNIEWEHRLGVQNVVAYLLSRNPVDSVEGSQISCAALRALAINSREQLIWEQIEDPELRHIYRYLENPDDGSVNARAGPRTSS
ncbi:retrovirus-related Pol polyprotein from transposon 297 [Trichonephila clavipes]|nr:retrovirus-related Pol polyprotein from transposon 297 [Trichonephila clavipes]